MLHFKLVAQELLVCCLKRVPFVGTAVECVEAVQNRFEKLAVETEVEALALRQSALEGSVRSLVEQTVVDVVHDLRSPTLAPDEMHDCIRTLDQVRDYRFNPILFEGLLRLSPHWTHLQKSPHDYGDLLPDGETPRNDRIPILVDAEKVRILQVAPFTLAQLLQRQNSTAVDRRAIVTGATDVWAFDRGDATTSPVKATRTAFNATATEPTRPVPVHRMLASIADRSILLAFAEDFAAARSALPLVKGETFIGAQLMRSVAVFGPLEKRKGQEQVKRLLAKKYVLTACDLIADRHGGNMKLWMSKRP